MTEPTAPRLLLTDAAVARQPFAENKPRILRDSKIPGFHCSPSAFLRQTKGLSGGRISGSS